jgi:hypothetical protein
MTLTRRRASPLVRLWLVVFGQPPRRCVRTKIDISRPPAADRELVHPASRITGDKAHHDERLRMTEDTA